MVVEFLGDYWVVFGVGGLVFVLVMLDLDWFKFVLVGVVSKVVLLLCCRIVVVWCCLDVVECVMGGDG